MEDSQRVGVPVVNIKVETDFKKINNLPHPEFLLTQDAINQYFGLWKIFWMYTSTYQSKKVLEFGTRDGYSTKLFSVLLKMTGGHLWTVDRDDPKMDEKLKDGMDNVTFIRSDVKCLPEELKVPYDILYIDDWHNPYHLFWELEQFGGLAKVILIHDVVLNWQTREWLLPAIFNWCLKEYMPFMVYPLNPCGLIAIHREEYKEFYEYE